jgi:hypothetical protein
MSYDLWLYFEPAVRRDRLVEHFAARPNFSITKDNVLYNNKNTGVYFFMRLRTALRLFHTNVVSAEFEINYHRPSFFGIEPNRCCPTSSRRFSRGSKILRCTAWERDLIPATDS